MTQAGKVVYTAKTHTTGGRDHGVARSSDGHLNVTLSTPGTAGSGTNPEQMFAAGWSACFEGAMAVVARRMRIPLPEDASIDAEVDLCSDNGSYSIQARLNVNLPGMEQEAAESLTNAAHEVCPYSKAIRGNVDVAINVTTGPAVKVA